MLKLLLFQLFMPLIFLNVNFGFKTLSINIPEVFYL